ncbi:hypothetical protein PIB30_001461 [Stylosanthes scabra]|uniref:F-box domain-containing protein n=1 Tax=Stylosanthes scabra TaxID=79078 RepID=A0ABU6Q2F2_9FABA|nr:hypothetical protein [Stylosanthes scabra]
MEEKQKQMQSSMNEILPLELIQIILLRVPAEHLARLRFVSKLWHSLISDPHFAKLHFNHSPATTNTNACLYTRHGSVTFLYLDALFGDHNEASLDRHQHFLVVWNPLTGSSKTISNPYASSSDPHGFRVSFVSLYGFGYDASQDDYLVVVAWKDMERQPHMDYFSLRTNSWINIDAALPKPLGSFNNYCGLFLNDAIHWLSAPLEDYSDAILIFDMKERTFSKISVPAQVVMRECTCPKLTLLAGCLALYYQKKYTVSFKTKIWVMKEYKVQSSWKPYEIPLETFRPLCLSNNGDIIGDQIIFEKNEHKIKFIIYNVRGDRLQHFKYHCASGFMSPTDAMYTESLMPLPIDLKDKDKKRKDYGM